MQSRGVVLALFSVGCGARTELLVPDVRTFTDARSDVASRSDAGSAPDDAGAVPSLTMCTPSCVGRACGSDRCGGSCGACAAGLFCGEDGQCGACPTGQPCNRGTACETGVIECAGGVQRCARGSFAPAGTACLGGTCDGRGACSAIAPSFLLIVDSSGSMRSADAGANECGFEPRRINSVACGVHRLARRAQDALWGMQTFGLECGAQPPFLRGTGNFGCGSSSCRYNFPQFSPMRSAGDGYPFDFYGCEDGGALWIPLSSRAQDSLRAWGDGVFSGCAADVALGALGGPDLVYSTRVWQETPSRFTPLAGSLRFAARYLSDEARPTRSPYLHFDGTTDVDPLGHRRWMNVILLTDGEECCSVSATDRCDVSASSIGAELNARNLGCLRVDLDQNGRIDDPLPMNHSNVALRGRYESNIDTNRDGDCYDLGEQRAFRVRVFVMAFGSTLRESTIEAIALAGGSPQRRVGGMLSAQRAYYIRGASDFARTIDELVSGSVVADP
jgi:hypothetical protein